MTTTPAIPFFGDAYLADTRHLSLEEHGAYLQLMMIAWRTPDCALPDDDARIARMLGITASKWAKLRPTIMAFWSLEDGRWIQKRLKKERTFVEEKRGKNAEAARHRWRRQVTENTHGDASERTTERSNGRTCERSSERNAPPPPPTNIGLGRDEILALASDLCGLGSIAKCGPAAIEQTRRWLADGIPAETMREVVASMSRNVTGRTMSLKRFDEPIRREHAVRRPRNGEPYEPQTADELERAIKAGEQFGWDVGAHRKKLAALIASTAQAMRVPPHPPRPA